MKTTLRALLCLNLSVLGCLFSAKAAAEQIQKQRFETIKALYESSDKPATLADFQIFGSTNTEGCFVARVNGETFQTSGLKKRILTSVITTPDGGPLFPGTISTSSRDVLVAADIIDFSLGYSNDLVSILNQASSRVHLFQDYSYLQMTIDHKPGGSSANWLFHSNKPLAVYIRKNGSFIVMKVMSQHSDKINTLEAYQYCWN